MQAQSFEQFIAQVQVMKPASVDPQSTAHLRRLTDLLADGSGYAAEEKIDGCHYLCFGHRFISSDQVEKTDNFPHLRDFFASLKPKMPNLILDGEINYPNKTSQFCTRVTGALPGTAIDFQQAMDGPGPIHYTMWDILRTPAGTWLINATYETRRALLEEFYDEFIRPTSMAEYIHLTDIRTRGKKEYYEDLIRAGKEGIVLKRLDGQYFMGRKPMWQWMKMKQQDTADLVILGYKNPTVLYTGKNVESWPYWKEVQGSLQPVTKDYYNDWIGALELGVYINGRPVHVCKCAGLDEEQKATISRNKELLLGKVVKITYMEKTEMGYPRHPRFEAFHESKTAQECTWQFN